MTCLLLLTIIARWTEVPDGEDEDVVPFPSVVIIRIAIGVASLAAILVLVSVLWQHAASVAATAITRDMANGSVKSGVGVSAMAIGWVGFTLLIIPMFGLVAMLLSMQMLESLVHDESEAPSQI
jgi:hypothetical protein